MTDYISSTPTDINSMQIGDVLKYLDGASGDTDIASPIVRLNVTKMLYDVLGMTLTPDIALAAVAEPQASLVLATAGGGKTTWAQTKAILQKITRKSRLHPGHKIKGAAILCLVYNKHNVQDMIDKHKRMVATLRARNIKGLDIDDEINACTLHSFCDFWRREYVAKMGLLGATLLEQSQAESFMMRAIKIACKKMGMNKEVNTIDSSDMFGLYMFYRETMCQSVQELESCNKFVDLGLPLELIEAIFAQYERSKELSHKYDFVDMLYKFYCLLRDDDTVRTRVQKFYEYVIADEVQDFTPLMWSILQLMVSDGTPLTCIGDEDQNIYMFRGADIKNLLQFTSIFEGGKIYSLEYNRRCKKRILDEARKVIEMNTLRFNKVLRNTKDGGEVTYESYNTLNGQFVNVLKLIKSMSVPELENTVICYRETASSTILADMLMGEDIIFNVISGVGPFSHELYRHMFEIMNALEMPYDMHNCISLYKVLPCTKDEFQKAIGYDPAKGRFKNDNVRGIHFKDFDYGKLQERESFVTTMQTLVELSAKISNTSVAEISAAVFQLMNKYFWGFKKSCNRFPDVDEIMQARILKYFQSPLLYTKFYQDYQHKKSCYKHYTAERSGLTISTFHSLKGLEFDNVIVICMDDSIYPNFHNIDSRAYLPSVKQALKESEVRLWYVAVTRAISKLHVFYFKDNPSLFVRFALEDNFPIAGKFQNGADAFESQDDAEELQKLVEAPVMARNEMQQAKTEAPAKIDMFETSLSSEEREACNEFNDFDELDELDDLDDVDNVSDVSVVSDVDKSTLISTQADNNTERQQSNTIDDHVTSSAKETSASEEKSTPDIAESFAAEKRSTESDNKLVWQNTADLVHEASAKEDNASEKTDSAEEDTQVQLKSGKSLYLNKLLSSF